MPLPAGSELSCNDGADNDCDGQTDCAADPACSCGSKGTSCVDGSECCSGSCKGKRGAKTCK